VKSCFKKQLSKFLDDMKKKKQQDESERNYMLLHLLDMLDTC